MSGTTEMRNMSASHGIGTFDEISGSRHSHRDTSDLARLGKQQVLKRRFGFISMFGFSCTILVTWESVLCSYDTYFENGGPAGLAWGFLIAWFCSLSVYSCLGEMASMFPIAGGQYFWVAMLAPPRFKRFGSYCVGWLTSIAWTATLATGIIYVGGIIQGIIILNYDDFNDQPYQVTLLAWAVIAVALFINTIVAGILPFLEGTILLIHVMGFIAIIIALVYLSPHGTAHSVFIQSMNGGNWSSQGLSFIIGFIGNVATFTGADAAVHMSEEIDNAAANVPRAILSTLLLNGTAGYGMVLALLFCIGDVSADLDSASGFPFIQELFTRTGRAGGTAMSVIVVALFWCAIIGFLATASRMVWSFARDKGLPGHRYISKVNKRSHVPLVAVGIVTIIPCALVCIYIGSPTAYNDVISLSVSGLFASYLIPCSFLLWRRTTGQIQPHGEDSEFKTYTAKGYTPSGLRRDSDKDADFRSAGIEAISPSGSDAGAEIDNEILVEAPLHWGPWKIPGVLGVANNILACVYCTWVLFWNFWPPETPVTPQNMNYSILVTSVAIGFAMVYYYVRGRKEYRGPIIDYEVRGVAGKVLGVGDRLPNERWTDRNRNLSESAATRTDSVDVAGPTGMPALNVIGVAK